MSECECVCKGARACACVRACVLECLCVRACERVCIHPCVCATRVNACVRAHARRTVLVAIGSAQNPKAQTVTWSPLQTVLRAQR